MVAIAEVIASMKIFRSRDRTSLLSYAMLFTDISSWGFLWGLRDKTVTIAMTTNELEELGPPLYLLKYLLRLQAFLNVSPNEAVS
jgi:hypothetical protein